MVSWKHGADDFTVGGFTTGFDTATDSVALGADEGAVDGGGGGAMARLDAGTLGAT